MTYADHVYVYPDAGSLHRLRIRRQDLPPGCVPIGIAHDRVDGTEVTVVVYVATGEASLSRFTRALESDARRRGRGRLRRAGWPVGEAALHPRAGP